MTAIVINITAVSVRFHFLISSSNFGCWQNNFWGKMGTISTVKSGEGEGEVIIKKQNNNIQIEADREKKWDLSWKYFLSSFISCYLYCQIFPAHVISNSVTVLQTLSFLFLSSLIFVKQELKSNAYRNYASKVNNGSRLCYSLSPQTYFICILIDEMIIHFHTKICSLPFFWQHAAHPVNLGP